MNSTGDPEFALLVESRSPDETSQLGRQLGSLLAAGDVLLLQGELGAGKTCLTQGIAEGLDVAEQVCSPTFILVGQYRGRLNLYHADLYRLENPVEVEDLDLGRSSEDGVLIVEWPERAPEWLPREHLLIKIDHEGPEQRRLAFQPSGPRPSRLLAAIREALTDASAPTAG